MAAAACVPLKYQSDPLPRPSSLTSRPKVPTPIVKLLPASSRGVLVMKLTTPDSALAPQIAEAGPRITSIWRTSFGFTGRKSQATKPKKSR